MLSASRVQGETPETGRRRQGRPYTDGKCWALRSREPPPALTWAAQSDDVMDGTGCHIWECLRIDWSIPLKLIPRFEFASRSRT